MDVSVIMVTYNHGKYVRQAIESIVNQKVNFAMEVLIVDDASQDDTVDILSEYKNKYPHLIRLWNRKNNSQHPTHNLYRIMQAAKGKYFSFLEGDDYWNDVYKLQKQYDFLEKNIEYSACMANIDVVNEKDERIQEGRCYFPNSHNVFTVDDFKSLGMPAMMCGFFMRNTFDEDRYKIVYTADKLMGDMTVFMLSLLQGSIYQFNEIMTTYRYVCKKGENNYNSINKENLYKDYNCLIYWINLENYMRKYYDKNYRIRPIKDSIIAWSGRYSNAAMFHAACQSKNYRYLLEWIIAKRFLYYGYKEYKSKVPLKRSWKNFWKDKRKLIIFGAGKMASLYLDRYGWKEDILFLVDNDICKQNTSFKGYLIKNPRELIKYVPKCKVLIANESFEEQIANQLQRMEIYDYYELCHMQDSLLAHKLLKVL